MDEVLEELNLNYKGSSLPNDRSCCCMAFADDPILIADNDLEVPLMLEDVLAFLERRGIAINTAKCRALVAGSMGSRSVVRGRPFYKINNVLIPNVDALDAFRYLDHEFGHTGMKRPTAHNLSTWLKNIQKAPLKPIRRP